jgi:hypothetical protein
MPMLLCRTVWLNHYDARANDPPYGNHGWVRGGNIPHEIKNFFPTIGGALLGFVQINEWGKIKIERLGATRGDHEIRGVTVVWCAQHPDGRGLVVVGWYLNATVYRERQPTPANWGMDDGEWPFRILGNISESQLVDSSLRDFVVQPAGTPKGELVFGQADLSYVDERFPALARRLQTYIDGQSRAGIVVSSGGGRWGGTTDPEQNARVEQAAIQFVTAHYSGWDARDVSRDNSGWDLEFTRRGQTHCVEVKGLTAACPAPVALTRNERLQFERAAVDVNWASQYRLALVHEAIASPQLRLYRHTLTNGWRCALTSEGISTQPLGLLVEPHS